MICFVRCETQHNEYAHIVVCKSYQFRAILEALSWGEMTVRRPSKHTCFKDPLSPKLRTDTSIFSSENLPLHSDNEHQYLPDGNQNKKTYQQGTTLYKWALKILSIQHHTDFWNTFNVEVIWLICLTAGSAGPFLSGYVTLLSLVLVKSKCCTPKVRASVVIEVPGQEARRLLPVWVNSRSISDSFLLKYHHVWPNQPIKLSPNSHRTCLLRLGYRFRAEDH